MGRFDRKTRKIHRVGRSKLINESRDICVVILGFEHRNSDALSLRLLTGVNEFFRLPSAWLLVTGGDTIGLGVTEGDDLASRAIAMGVPSSRILVEDRARNTIENAIFTYRILATKLASIVLVTNEFHMARSLRVFQDVDVDNRFTIIPRPAPNGDLSLLLSQTGSSLSQWVAHENKQLKLRSTSIRNASRKRKRGRRRSLIL